MDRRTLLWPAVHDPLADTDTETVSSHDVEAAENVAHDIERDKPTAMGGLTNEEVQAEELRREVAAQEARELENILQNTGRHLCGRAGSNVTGDAGTEQHSRYFGRIPGTRAGGDSTGETRNGRHSQGSGRYLRKHQGIQQLTEVMIAAVEASAGRAGKTTHVRFLVGHEKEAMKDSEQYLCLCAQVRSASDPTTLRKCRQARNVFCRHMRKRRRHWKGRWLKRLIQRVGDAAEMGDWGRFYQVLRELGQSTYDLKRRDKQEHTAPVLRTHYAAISAEINEVEPEVLAELKNPLPINEELSTPLNNVEVMREIKNERLGSRS